MREIIIGAMAKAIWAQWWAEQCSCGRHDFESCRLSGRAKRNPTKHRELGSYPGGDIMDIVPLPPPDDAVDTARDLAWRIDTAAGMRTEDAFRAAMAAEGVAPGSETGEDAEDFGHCIAMQALGHGVSWGDKHTRLPFAVPHIDYAGDDINVGARRLQSGYASSQRNPRRPAEFVSGEPERYRFVGFWYHPDTMTRYRAFRLRASRPRQCVIPLLDARIPQPRYIFQMGAQ